MDAVLVETARRCIEEVGKATGPLSADSSAAETARCETVERPDKKEPDFVETRRKIYWKYHISAVLGLQVVLAAFCTPGNVNDTVMLQTMLAETGSRGFDFVGCVFTADRGYDSDENCAALFWSGMSPNIRQWKDAVDRGKPSRKKAETILDRDEYRKRPLIEGIFGAEESRRHQLHCRFVRDDNRRLFV